MFTKIFRDRQQIRNVCTIIQDIFPNYQEDITFGGSKKLVHVSSHWDRITIHHMESGGFMSANNSILMNSLNSHYITNFNSTIKNGIYDLYSPFFVNKLKHCKTYINNVYIDTDSIMSELNENDKIHNLLLGDCIIKNIDSNNHIHCFRNDKKNTCFHINNYGNLYIININNKYYETSYLHK